MSWVKCYPKKNPSCNNVVADSHERKGLEWVDKHLNFSVYKQKFCYSKFMFQLCCYRHVMCSNTLFLKFLGKNGSWLLHELNPSDGFVMWETMLLWKRAWPQAGKGWPKTMQIFTSCLNTRLYFSALSMFFIFPLSFMLMMFLILCSTERVQSPACGSKVRQDGGGQSPPTEEGCARCCWKGETSLKKEKKHNTL